MTDLDKQLRDLTVEITCKHCYKTHSVMLTGFGGTYICECGERIKTTETNRVIVILSSTDEIH